ncbi:MAG: Hpt domain-containing protein [Gemmatimonadota bacterium]|nr:Hpt domain-containing protein [Gemmatimonadota bacterium]MDH5803942.1 Hpt domain-containing protein [Gemmatimonadota bacterium]
MTQSMGMADFFAMEAGEYLERLDSLTNSAQAPDFSELHRLARALRGSALMAKQQQIAEVAGGVEQLAKSVRESRLAWDQNVQHLLIRAIDDLKILVRGSRDWNAELGAKAANILAEIHRTVGDPVQATPVQRAHESVEQGPDAGTRAFIAREGASVGSALDHAAKTLARNPDAVQALDSVMRATQPLRGIASLSDLPPLPDLLEGIERAIQELSRRSGPTPNIQDVFEAAARAVSKASQEISVGGQADPDSNEAREFATQLGALLGMSPDLVPIDTLFHDDQGPHVVEQGQAVGEPLGNLELVSLGEHLKQVASDLEQAVSIVQRQLRSCTLVPTLRQLSSSGGEAVRFSGAVQYAVAQGVAMQSTQKFAELIRHAGNAMSTSQGGNVLNQAFGQAAQGLLQLAGSPSGAQAHQPQPTAPAPIAPVQAAPAPPAAAPTPPAAAPVQAPPELPTLPPLTPPMTPAAAPAAIAPPQAAPAFIQPTPPPAVPTIPLTPPEMPVPQERAAADAGGLEGLAASYSTLFELSTGGGNGSSPLAALLGQTAPSPTAPVEAAIQPPAAPPASAPEPAPIPQPPAQPVRPITDFIYDRDSALKRAAALRESIKAAVGQEQADLMDEVFDLVEIGLK